MQKQARLGHGPDCFPSSLLGIAFGFLSEAEVFRTAFSVCRRWQAVCPLWSCCVLTGKNAALVAEKWTPLAITRVVVQDTFDVAMVARLCKLPNLCSLSAYGLELADGVLAGLQGLRLRYLELDVAAPSPQVFAELGSLQSVRVLTLTFESLPPASLSPLRQLARLKTLLLLGCEEFALTSQTTPPNLRHLCLVDSAWPRMWEEISALHQVRKLTLDDTNLDDDKLATLRTMRSLRNLVVKNEEHLTGRTLHCLVQIECLTLGGLSGLEDCAFMTGCLALRRFRIINCARQLTYRGLSDLVAWPGLREFELKHWIDRFYAADQFKRFLNDLGYQVLRLSVAGEVLHVTAKKI